MNNDKALALNLNVNSLEALDAFVEGIKESSLVPSSDTKEDVKIKLLAGAELGIGITSALSNIYVINGRVTLSVHIIEAKLRAAGVITEILEYDSPMYIQSFYEFREDEDNNIVTVKGKDNKPKIIGQKLVFQSEIEDLQRAFKALELEKTTDPTITKLDLENAKPRIGKSVVAFGTKVRMTRMLKQPDGSYRDMTNVFSYNTMTAALGASKNGDKDKDTWIKYRAEMLYASVIRKGGKIMADDLIMQLPETTEMLNHNNINFDINEDGSYKIYDKNGNEVKTKKEASN